MRPDLPRSSLLGVPWYGRVLRRALPCAGGRHRGRRGPDRGRRGPEAGAAAAYWSHHVCGGHQPGEPPPRAAAVAAVAAAAGVLRVQAQLRGQAGLTSGRYRVPAQGFVCGSESGTLSVCEREGDGMPYQAATVLRMEAAPPGGVALPDADTGVGRVTAMAVGPSEETIACMTDRNMLLTAVLARGENKVRRPAGGEGHCHRTSARWGGQRNWAAAECVGAASTAGGAGLKTARCRRCRRGCRLSSRSWRHRATWALWWAWPRALAGRLPSAPAPTAP